MSSGDLLLTFTDGIPDALNSQNDFFGKERLRAAMAGAGGDPARVVGQIENDLHHFVGETQQFDDITLVAVRRR